MLGRTLCALAGALIVSAPAHAQDGHNMWGGRVVDRVQFYTQAGWPEVEVGGRFPIGDSLELSPNARFGLVQGREVGPLTFSPALDLRAEFLRSGRFHLAAAGSVPLHVIFDDVTGFGVGLLHPGLLMTWSAGDVLDVDTGLQFRDDLYFTEEGVAFAGALPVLFALEGDVADRIQLGLRLEVGPEFGARTGAFDTAGDASVGVWAQALAGIGVAI